MTVATCQGIAAHRFEPLEITARCPKCGAPQAPARPLYPMVRDGGAAPIFGKRSSKVHGD